MAKILALVSPSPTTPNPPPTAASSFSSTISPSDPPIRSSSAPSDPSASISNSSSPKIQSFPSSTYTTLSFSSRSSEQAAVLDFLDSGKDLILAADPTTSELIKGIAANCGIDFDEVSGDFDDGFRYCFHAVSDTEGGHTLIASEDFVKSDVNLERQAD